MADVVFSFKTESIGLVEKLAQTFEAAGISCWYANRDSKPGNYSGNISRAIKECRIFLIVLDRLSLHSAHVKTETALAFRRFAQGEPITLIPFRVDDCNVQEDEDLDYFLVLQQIVDGSPPDTKHIKNLLYIVTEILRTPA